MRIGRTLGRWLDKALERNRRRLVEWPPPVHGDEGDHADTVTFVRDNTMTSPARVRALCDAVQHVARHGIPGAIVECGVWRGGSMMAVARTLMAMGVTDRDLYLFDTFEGMPPPTEHDKNWKGDSAAHLLKTRDRSDAVWAIAPLDIVKAGMARTGYPAERIHYVVGKVEDTIPANAPRDIALLRLDTDWYSSTRHEWEHLYPRLKQGGVVIIDDYGHWEGSRKATDEFLQKSKARLLLTRIDAEARLAVKLDK